MAHPTGESKDGVHKLDFDRSLMLQFRGSVVTSDAATRQTDAAAGNELGSDSKNDIADCFLRLAALPTFALDRLSRYEHLLWRQARQIVFTLESLRRRKPPPSRSTFPFSFQRREPGALSEKFR